MSFSFVFLVFCFNLFSSICRLFLLYVRLQNAAHILSRCFLDRFVVSTFLYLELLELPLIVFILNLGLHEKFVLGLELVQGELLLGLMSKKSSWDFKIFLHISGLSEEKL